MTCFKNRNENWYSTFACYIHIFLQHAMAMAVAANASFSSFLQKSSYRRSYTHCSTRPSQRSVFHFWWISPSHIRIGLISVIQGMNVRMVCRCRITFTMNHDHRQSHRTEKSICWRRRRQTKMCVCVCSEEQWRKIVRVSSLSDVASLMRQASLLWNAIFISMDFRSCSHSKLHNAFWYRMRWRCFYPGKCHFYPKTWRNKKLSSLIQIKRWVLWGGRRRR